jgi:hypothetical protein
MIEVMEEQVNTDWYQKAENVVMTAKNQDQLNVALKYIEFYKEQTKDIPGYEILLRKFNQQMEELSCE